MKALLRPMTQKNTNNTHANKKNLKLKIVERRIDHGVRRFGRNLPQQGTHQPNHPSRTLVQAPFAHSNKVSFFRGGDRTSIDEMAPFRFKTSATRRRAPSRRGDPVGRDANGGSSQERWTIWTKCLDRSVSIATIRPNRPGRYDWSN